MNLYVANASCDWGHIFQDRQVKASNFGVAFRRAAGMAQREARKRPKEIVVRVRLVGSEARITRMAEAVIE